VSADEIVHRRELDAPRELVWRCLTEPVELARFWGPAGMHTPVEGIVVELREGGRFETPMVGEHGTHTMAATFTEVDPPATLSWRETASGMHTTSTLRDLGDGRTELVVHQRHVPEPARTPEAQAGFGTSLDKLGEHVARHAWIATTYAGLADLLEHDDRWDDPSLCEGWRARHVVAHVTMPVRLDAASFGAEMAAAGGDFGVLSDTVAARDSALPVTELLGQLRSPDLHAWEPPAGGSRGALVHAVVHSLDVTVAGGAPPVAPPAALAAVRDVLADGTVFDVDLTRVDLDDPALHAAHAVALLAGRTLPDGRSLRQR
jgi:uncharacterized protein (TIGR03083 family)